MEGRLAGALTDELGGQLGAIAQRQERAFGVDGRHHRACLDMLAAGERELHEPLACHPQLLRADHDRKLFVLDLYQLGSVLRRERRTVRTERRELWSSPVLFFVFLAAVTTEWIIRRRNHLI